jgi:hypothetical protein
MWYLLVESAEAPFAVAEPRERGRQILSVEVRPSAIDEVELGIGALPEQEVGEPPLPAGADEKVDVPGLASVNDTGQRLGEVFPSSPAPRFSQPAGWRRAQSSRQRCAGIRSRWRCAPPALATPS